MDSVQVIVAMLVALAVASLLAKGKKQETGKDLRFAKQGALFSAAERSFLGVLEQVLDNRYRVFGKVRLGDLVAPQKGLSRSRRTTAWNKVHQKHVDFVICLASDLSVLGVVELDDNSHSRSDRKQRDRFIDFALSDAGIPVLHFPAQKAYHLLELKSKVSELINPTTAIKTPTSAIARTPASLAAAPVQADRFQSGDIQPATTPSVSAAPVSVTSDHSHHPLPQPIQGTPEHLCAKCASTMVKRQAKKGPHTGEWFWACTAFPKCRQVVKIQEA